MPRKVLTIEAAAAALEAVLSIGGIAAAASQLPPDQASPMADQAPATAGPDAAAHGLGKAAAAHLGGAAHAGSAERQGRASAVGPDATAAARVGLCRAWQAGQGGDHGQRAESVAFQALVDAAGGVDKVAAYCEDVAAGGKAGGHGGSQASPQASRHRAAAPPRTRGPPASTGPGGHGQGRPPTTTG